MKDILIIAHFTSFKSEGGNNRFNYIAEKLAKLEDIQVELVTSSFFHTRKTQREEIEENDYKVTLLYEPGYRRNVSLSRLYSHWIFGRNLKAYLEKRKKPDCIYCAVPSLSVAETASKYAKKNEIRFILDVQDLWPEAFEMVFGVPMIKDILFYPMKRMANRIYASADEIVAVSETYKERALRVNDKVSDGYSVFLGTDLDIFDRYKDEYKEVAISKEQDEIWLAYIGTLGKSYDLFSVFRAMEILRAREDLQLKFIVMGDGPMLDKFAEYAEERQLRVVFKGRMQYSEMVGLLSKCDIAINPIKKGSAGSIINKVGDYAAAGLPVINTQECLEYRSLIESYQCGVNCRNENAEDIANAICKLCRNDELRRIQGINNRKLAEKLFDREVAYKKIFVMLQN